MFISIVSIIFGKATITIDKNDEISMQNITRKVMMRLSG